MFSILTPPNRSYSGAIQRSSHERWWEDALSKSSGKSARALVQADKTH